MIPLALPIRTDGETWTQCGACNTAQAPEDFFCSSCGRAQFPDPYKAIFAAPMPERRPDTLNRWDTVTINKAVRHLLKELAIPNCRVTKSASGRYSHIELPRVIHEHEKPDGAPALLGHGIGVWHCPLCNRHKRAQEHLNRLLLAAFPNLDDRDDPYHRTYDFVFSFA